MSANSQLSIINSQLTTRLPGFSGKWEMKRLGDVATFYKGKGLPKSALSESGANPCIHYGELFTRYPETIENIFSRTDISEDVFRSVANDVLMPTSDVTPRGLAKASCVRVDGVILGGDILVIRSDRNLVHGPFLSLVIRHQETQVLQLVTGSTVYHLYGSDMKNFALSMPPLPEQIAIASALSDADALIESLEQLIAKKRGIKQATMQALLTPPTAKEMENGKLKMENGNSSHSQLSIINSQLTTRLPGFSGKWEVKRLGDICSVSRGGSPRPIQDFITTDSSGINWIKIGDVGVGAKYIDSTEEKIKPSGVSRSRFVTSGDFLLSNSMSFGRPYILRICGCIHDGWLVIQNYQTHFNTEYLYYYLGSAAISAQYLSKAAGSSVLNLNKEIVSDVEVLIPDLAEQTAIAEVLSDMDAGIEALEGKLCKTRAIKQGMMQELLTGKIRLVN